MRIYLQFCSLFWWSFFYGQLNKHFYLQHINKVIDAINYVQSSENGIIIFVPRDNVALSVSESKQIPENISHKILAYHHHSMKGDIEAKKRLWQFWQTNLNHRKKHWVKLTIPLKVICFMRLTTLTLGTTMWIPPIKGTTKSCCKNGCWRIGTLVWWNLPNVLTGLYALRAKRP